MVSAPNRLSILGLGKRAPSEESNTLKSLPNACSALPTTKGARVMLSTPPATHTSASPQGVACDVAAVLAGLGGAADRHVIDDLRSEARARHHLLDDAGQEIVGADARQGARVPAERRAQSVIDVGFEHGLASPPAMMLNTCVSARPMPARLSSARLVGRFVHL